MRLPLHSTAQHKKGNFFFVEKDITPVKDLDTSETILTG